MMSSGQGSERARWRENDGGQVKTVLRALSGARGGCAVLCCTSHDCSKYIAHKALTTYTDTKLQTTQLKNRDTEEQETTNKQSQRLYWRPFLGSSVGFQSFELSLSKSLFAISCANAQYPFSDDEKVLAMDQHVQESTTNILNMHRV